jgi:hypothetical protein
MHLAEIKVKGVPLLPRRHEGGGEISTYSFLTLAVNVGEWRAFICLLGELFGFSYHIIVV